MAKEAAFLYRCRICGSFTRGLIGHPEKVRFNILMYIERGEFAVGRTSKFDKEPDKAIFHECNDGRIGIADLVGYEMGEK